MPQEALIFQTIGHSLAEVSRVPMELMNVEMRVKLKASAWTPLVASGLATPQERQINVYRDGLGIPY